MLVRVQGPLGPCREVTTLVGRLVAQVCAEPGNRVLAAHRRAGQPDVFFAHQGYVDQEAFQQHTTADHSRSFDAALGELLGAAVQR